MPGDKDEKTEAPTPRRRMEARRRGQVARSQDLNAAVLTLAGVVAMYFLGPMLWRRLLALVVVALSPVERYQPADELAFWAVTMVIEIWKYLLPLLAILIVTGGAVLLGQVGLLFTPESIKPKLDKLNPLNGLKRIFSLRTFVTAGINIGKLLVVCAVAYVTLKGAAAEILYAFTLGIEGVFLMGARLSFRLGVRLALLLLILALMDLAYQRYKHEKDMKMTKEEVKDEMRSMEGDPVVKRRRREVQLQLAMQRLQRDVPQADVVVTNPTHLAIAIRYDAESMAAPKVLAKGADEMALRIRRIAQEHHIPIVERRALVRLMYDAVEPGQSIPERFYQAIAEILAYVYELTGRNPLAA